MPDPQNIDQNLALNDFVNDANHPSGIANTRGNHLSGLCPILWDLEQDRFQSGSEPCRQSPYQDFLDPSQPDRDKQPYKLSRSLNSFPEITLDPGNGPSQSARPCHFQDSTAKPQQHKIFHCGASL